jgi:pantoate--beta-alanine ligase
MTGATAATTVVHTRADLSARRATARGEVAVVMTMGALHEGHAALLRAARERADTVIATIFVNPLQFGPQEDLDRYPRTLESDLARCREAGVDLVFAPSVTEMYPSGDPAVRVDPGPLGAVLEGASRPGHFAGVLTVVLKLLHLTRPDLTFFGEKDYQQLTLVRAMVTDLDLPVRVIGVPTVREPDGLALSSRNRYLSPAQREAARAVPAALRAGADAAGRGAAPAEVLTAAHATVPEVATGVALEYLALTDPALRPLTPPVGTEAGPVVEPPGDGRGRLLIAARVGTTRLIDNIEIRLAQGSQ